MGTPTAVDWRLAKKVGLVVNSQKHYAADVCFGQIANFLILYKRAL